MATNDREIEVKLRIEDLAKLRAKLKRLRAKAGPRMFERNVLYDNPQDDLRLTGRLLRIRIESPAPESKSARRRRPTHRLPLPAHGVLTYKAPITGLTSAPNPSRYKERQEIEIVFQPANALESILRALGFRPGFTYEKFRTEHRLPSLKGLHLDVDETPIGTYLELEGPPAAIDRAALLLGFNPQDYITSTYRDLYVADCRGRRVTPSDLVFKPQKKSP